MVTKEPYFSLVKTGASSWSAVLVQNGQPYAQAHPNGISQASAQNAKPAVQGGLFAGARNVSRDWTKNFSRIAIAMTALLLAKRG
jgi:hypothetical protein